MNHRKKHRARTRPRKTTARKARVSWWFVAIPIASLVLLAATSSLLKRRPMDRLQFRPDSNAPIALGPKVTAVSPSSPDTVNTNDTESDDVDKAARSEEHTSELQSQSNLVCRLLLEKKKN